MVSFLTLIAKSIAGALLYVLKAFFSMMAWFLKAFFRLLKLFYVLLPVTSLIFSVLYIFNAFLLIKGCFIPDLPGLPGQDAALSHLGEDTGEKVTLLLDNNRSTLFMIFESLRQWWLSTSDSCDGTWKRYFMLLLTVMLFVPVVLVLLGMSVFISFWLPIFGGIVADAVLYVVRAAFGNHFIPQIRGRLGRLFPKQGVKYEERDYARNLKKRNKELKDELREKKQHKWDSYYDEVYGEDEEFEEEYGDDYDEYDD